MTAQDIVDGIINLYEMRNEASIHELYLPSWVCDEFIKETEELMTEKVAIERCGIPVLKYRGFEIRSVGELNDYY